MTGSSSEIRLDPFTERSSAAPGHAVPPALILGLVGALAVCVGGTLAGSPFDTHLPGAWFFGMGHHRPLTRDLGKTAVFAGLAMLLVAWLRIVAHLRRYPSTPVRLVLVVVAVWTLPFLISPPLFSQDPYSYFAQGTMVARGVNPYDHGPDAIRSTDPTVVSLVDPLWQQTRVPYGPLYLGLEAGAVEFSGHREAAGIEELRLLALAGVALAASVLPMLSRRGGTPPALSVALVALNPLTLLGLISPAHNDALMVGLLLGGLALLQRGRPGWAIAVCALAGSIKAPAFVATAYVTWQWCQMQGSTTARVRVAVAASAITFGLLEALSTVTGVGWGWLHTMGTPNLVHSVLTPATAVAMLGEGVVHVLRHGPGTATLIAVSNHLFLVGAAIVVSLLMRRSREIGLTLALALSLLAVVALASIFQPWYLAWGLFCLAPVAAGRWRLLFIGVSIYGTVAVLPRFEPLLSSLSWAGELLGLAIAVALASLTLSSVSSRVAGVLAPLEKYLAT
jgi:alpha-1,6-mannosyltransferase